MLDRTTPNRVTPYPQRAVRVGGWFTCGLLLINGFLANIETLPAVLISLGAGAAFTAGSLAVGRRYKLR